MSNNNDNFVSIGDLLKLCLKRWYWFVIAVAVCMAVAMYKTSKAKPKYTTEATIMVLQDKEGKSSNGTGNEFSGMKFIYQNDNMNNVVKELTSLEVLMEVVRRMDLTSDEKYVVDHALSIRGRLSADVASKQSTLINLSFWDYSLERSRQILELVVEVYDEKWQQNNRDVIATTSTFIDSRLRLLESELDSVENGISDYKSRHGITDISRVSDMYLQQQNRSNEQIMTLNNQRSMAVYIRDLLKDKESPLQPLPVNIGINNEIIENQITLYNKQLMQLKSHLDYTSELNPRIVIQQRELQSLRNNIENDVNNYIKTLDIQIRSLRRYNQQATNKVTSNPSQAMELASIEREKKVKEDLYMYLLQKKEENEITGTFQHSNIKIIDIPHWNGSAKTGRLKTLAAALLLGFLLPITLIFILAINDKTIRNRGDVESRSSLDLIGEIPLYGKKRKKRRQKGLVVEDGQQDPLNEAFRLLRTNLLKAITNADNDEDAASEVANASGRWKKTGGTVLMVTSSDSEAGKTFVSTNLSIALALHNRRVLFVDGDLRDGDASQLFGATGNGLSNYLDSSDADYAPLLVSSSNHPTLDILPSGDLPNNPTELLASQRFGDLIAILRESYDFIIIDTPETGLLADADIILNHVDATLFVVRVGKTNRDQLDELVAGQQKNRYNHLAVVLNR